MEIEFAFILPASHSHYRGTFCTIYYHSVTCFVCNISSLPGIRDFMSKLIIFRATTWKHIQCEWHYSRLTSLLCELEVTVVALTRQANYERVERQRRHSRGECGWRWQEGWHVEWRGWANRQYLWRGVSLYSFSTTVTIDGNSPMWINLNDGGERKGQMSHTTHPSEVGEGVEG